MVLSLFLKLDVTLNRPSENGKECLVLKKDDKDFESRLTQSIETAIDLSNGKLIINDGKNGLI